MVDLKSEGIIMFIRKKLNRYMIFGAIVKSRCLRTIDEILIEHRANRTRFR
jgi:hypothetical protein